MAGRRGDPWCRRGGCGRKPPARRTPIGGNRVLQIVVYGSAVMEAWICSSNESTDAGLRFCGEKCADAFVHVVRKGFNVGLVHHADVGADYLDDFRLAGEFAPHVADLRQGEEGTHPGFLNHDTSPETFVPFVDTPPHPLLTYR